MSQHTARIEKHVAIITKNMVPGWFEYDIPRVGRVSVNCMPAEMAAASGANQCWVRVGEKRCDFSDDVTARWSWEHELRGSAEAVAKELALRFLKAPSKAIQEAAEAIEASFSRTGTLTFDGMRAEEVSAWLGLDELVTFRALDFLAERGIVVNKGDRGWFRCEA